MKTIANSQIFRTVFEQRILSFEKDHPNGPSLKVKIKGGSPKEGYTSSMSQGKLTLEGNHPGSLLLGIDVLSLALKNEYIADSLGDRKPRFSLRPLHFCREWKSMPEEKICQRLLQMGYNAVISDAIPEKPELFQELGIQIILKVTAPQATPFDDVWDIEVESLDQIDAIYWEGTYTRPEFSQHENARDLLQIDLAKLEVQKLEERIDNQCALIFALPAASTVAWIPEFIDEVGSQTMIAFSAVNGNPTQDHFDPHPLWELLRESRDTSATPLLPILNMGGVNQGEGLWPIVPLDLIELAIFHMRRQPFSGAIVLTRDLPKKGSFLEGSLWLAAQSQWGDFSPHLLLESWCKVYHPELTSLEILTDLRRVGRQLSALKRMENISSEEFRTHSDSLIGELNRLQISVSRLNSGRSPSLTEYFVYFARDARRQILHFLQVHNAPMVNVLNGDDLLESFWTTIQQGGGSSLTSGAKVSLLNTPKMGDEGSVMRKIYEEVSLLN